MLFYLMALLAKISVAGVWLLLPLLAWHKQSTRRDWLKTIPFGLLSAALLLWATVGRHITTQHLVNDYRPWYLPFSAYSLLSSATRLLWPFRLSPIYPYPSHALAIASLIALIALVLYTLRGYLKKKQWSFWLIWLLVCTAPSAAIAPRLISISGDRYTYLACLPVLLCLAWLASKLRPAAGYICLGLLLALAAFGTIRYSAAWTDDHSLWDYAVASQPESCWTWYTRGFTIKAESGFAAAISDFRQAGDHCIGNQQMSNMIGLIMMDNQHFNEALIYFKNSLAAREEASTHYNLAMAYLGLKQPVLACSEIKRALELGLKPDPAIKTYCPQLKY
jgi:tetratricopeptide (TPR) repeat protein